MKILDIEGKEAKTRVFHINECEPKSEKNDIAMTSRSIMQVNKKQNARSTLFIRSADDKISHVRRTVSDSCLDDAEKNKLKVLSIIHKKLIKHAYFYLFVLFGIGLSFVLSFTFYRFKEDSYFANILDIFLILLMLTSVASLCWQFLYIATKRNESDKGNPSLAQKYWAYSVSGVKLSFFMQIGIIIFGLGSIYTIFDILVSFFTEDYMCINYYQVMRFNCECLFIAFQLAHTIICQRIIFIKHIYKQKALAAFLIFVNGLLLSMKLTENVCQAIALHAERTNLLEARLHYNRSEVNCSGWDYTANRKYISFELHFNVVAIFILLHSMFQCGKTNLIKEYSDDFFLIYFKEEGSAIIFNFLVIFSACLYVTFYVVLGIEKQIVFLGLFYITYHAIMNVLGIIFCVMFLKEVRYLKFTVTYVYSSFAPVLFHICFTSTANFIMIDLINSLPTLSNLIVDYLNVRGIEATRVLHIAHVILQTYCLRIATSLCMRSRAEVISKPGRGWVCRLIGVNLCLWLLHVISQNEVLSSDIQLSDSLLFLVKVTGKNNRLLFILVNMFESFSALYYYISVINLSDVFSSMYHMEQDRVKRYCVRVNLSKRLNYDSLIFKKKSLLPKKKNLTIKDNRESGVVRKRTKASLFFR